MESLHTYVVVKIDGARWALRRGGDGRDLCYGTFMNTWLEASEKASADAPARVIAVNGEGSVVAQAIFRTNPSLKVP